MPRFAILNNNYVTNIIVADSLIEAESVGKAVEFTDENPANIGWTYNEESKQFIVPTAEIQNTEEPNA